MESYFLALFDFLGLNGLFVASHQLNHIYTFGKVADVVIFAFGSLKRFYSFTEQIEHNYLSNRIRLVLDIEIFRYRIWVNGQIGPGGMLGAKRKCRKQKKKYE